MNKYYSKGYAAGKKYNTDRIKELENELKNKSTGIETKKERIYMKSLELVLQNCDGWKINNNVINSAEAYCELASIFSDNSITKC